MPLGGHIRKDLIIMNNIDNNGKDNAPGQNKEYNIIVNGKEKTFSGKFISFKQVIELAFSVMVNDGKTRYTVFYYKGENDKKEGTMVNGDTVPVKEGMEFRAERTNKS